MSPQESLAEFYKQAEKLGFSKDDIKKILTKHSYTEFRANMIPVYLAVLKAEANIEEEKKTEQEQKAVEQAEIKKARHEYMPIPCPVCGSPTAGDLKWYGKYTHKPGWRCTKGGLLHFFWVRQNESRRERGLPEIPYEEMAKIREEVLKKKGQE